MKTRLFGLATLLAATSLSAAESKFSGVHVGAQTGYAITTMKIDAKATTGDNKGSSEGNAKGFLGGFSLGYLHNVAGNFLIGADLEANMTSGKSKHDISAETINNLFRLTTKSGVNYAGSLVFGYALTDVMPYVKLGYSMHKYKFALARRADPDSGVLTHNIKKSKTLSGLRVSLGTQVALSDCVLLGFEYGHTLLSKKISIADDGAYPGVAGASRSFTVKPNAAQSFKVRLTYRFGM